MKRHMIFAALAAAAILGLSAPAGSVELGRVAPVITSSSGPFAGYAISDKGRVFLEVSQNDPAAARAVAKYNCETARGVTGQCNVFAVEPGIKVVGVVCAVGNKTGGFLGAERDQTALRNALDKANVAGFSDRDCDSKVFSTERTASR